MPWICRLQRLRTTNVDSRLVRMSTRVGAIRRQPFGSRAGDDVGRAYFQPVFLIEKTCEKAGGTISPFDELLSNARSHFSAQVQRPQRRSDAVAASKQAGFCPMTWVDITEIRNRSAAARKPCGSTRGRPRDGRRPIKLGRTSQRTTPLLVRWMSANWA